MFVWCAPPGHALHTRTPARPGNLLLGYELLMSNGDYSVSVPDSMTSESCGSGIVFFVLFPVTLA